VYNYNPRRTTWDASAAKNIENLYSVTALGWKPDGSGLAVVSAGRCQTGLVSSFILFDFW
jgi:Tfp pilus assembly protein PilX